MAIELNDLEQPIGTISAIKTDERVESVEIGYCIGKRFWNNGYMTEALTAIIRFFINEVGAGRIWARHDTENPNSGKVMVAAGMDYEGTLRHAGFNNQGICDEAVYAKVRSAALDEEPEEETPEQQAVTTKVMGEDGVMRNVTSDETIEYVGILAKLELSPEEAEAAKKDMADMLDYIDKLEELDTSGIEPMSHVFPVNNVFRDDVVTNGDGSEATLANAPVKKDGDSRYQRQSANNGKEEKNGFNVFNCRGTRQENTGKGSYSGRGCKGCHCFYRSKRRKDKQLCHNRRRGCT